MVSAVIYNRLHDRMALGIDATLRYGLHIPPTESIHQSQLETASPYNTSALARRAAADADRESRPRLAAGRRAPGKGELPLLRAQAGQEAPLLHAEPRRVQRVQGCAPIGDRRRDAVGRAARPAGSRVALAADAERCLRGAGARSCLRATRGRTGRIEGGGRGARRARVRGRERDDSPQQAVAALCDEADGESVNTLVLRDGRVLGFNTDQEILRGIEAERVCLIGAGGAAEALLPALPARCVVLPARDWPPDASGCDLVVNATPVRDELLVQPSADSGGRPRLQRGRETDGAGRGGPGCGLPRRRRRPGGARAPGRGPFRLWTGVERLSRSCGRP